MLTCGLGAWPHSSPSNVVEGQALAGGYYTLSSLYEQNRAFWVRTRWGVQLFTAYVRSKIVHFGCVLRGRDGGKPTFYGICPGLGRVIECHVTPHFPPTKPCPRGQPLMTFPPQKVHFFKKRRKKAVSMNLATARAKMRKRAIYFLHSGPFGPTIFETLTKF